MKENSRPFFLKNHPATVAGNGKRRKMDAGECFVFTYRQNKTTALIISLK